MEEASLIIRHPLITDTFKVVETVDMDSFFCGHPSSVSNMIVGKVDEDEVVGSPEGKIAGIIHNSSCVVGRCFYLSLPSENIRMEQDVRVSD